MYFHHVRDITVSGFSSETAPNSAEPAAGKVFLSGKIDRPRGHAFYLRFVDVGGAEVPAATASFTPWFRDENSGAWVSSAPVVAALSGRLQLIAMTGDAFVQVTALGSVGSSVTVQVWVAEVAGDAAIDGTIAAASAQIAGAVEAGSLDVEDDAAVGGDLDVTGGATVGGDLDVVGAATVGGALGVTGLLQAAGIPRAAGSASAFTASVLLSNPVDVTGLNDIVFPAMPGFYFWVISNSRVITTHAAGTATGAVTVKIGNNATNDNVVAASGNSPTTASHAAAVAATSGKAIGGGSLIVGPVGALVDLSTPLTGKVTIAGTGTGGFAWTCRYALLGVLLPASSI